MAPEAEQRLLKAWRGEILAGSVYELIARRMPDREGEILRRMAQAESGHHERLEQRMGELGVAVPDPASVRVPLWLRLQARIAPVDRLLAARESSAPRPTTPGRPSRRPSPPASRRASARSSR
jgi:rubrerythrin